MNLFSVLLMTFSISFSVFAGQKRAWNQVNNPNMILGNQKWETKLSKLKVSSQSEQQVWSGHFWPNFSGGIALRWEGLTNYQDVPNSSLPHFYKTPSKRELKRMTAEQISKLSPAEKYDIYNARYDYPTVKRERKRTGPDHTKWMGICEGWSAASVKYNEPGNINLTSKDGINILFHSGDTKALLDYYESQFAAGSSGFIGSRCNSGDGGSNGSCWDTNPGALHIVLANKIGIQRKAMIMDKDPGPEVWNQPVFAYQSTITNKSGINPMAAPGTVREVTVKTVVWYVQEIAPWYTPIQNPPVIGANYEYTLELDRRGRIIGGEWISNARPDFFWTPATYEVNVPYFQGILDIYKMANQNNNRPYSLEGFVPERY